MEWREDPMDRGLVLIESGLAVEEAVKRMQTFGALVHELVVELDGRFGLTFLGRKENLLEVKVCVGDSYVGKLLVEMCSDAQLRIRAAAVVSGAAGRARLEEVLLRFKLPVKVITG